MERASAASGEERKADSSPLKWFGMTKGFEVQKIYQIHKVTSFIKRFRVSKKECRNAPGCAGRNSRKGSPMYSGTLIDDLIATVEQAETKLQFRPTSQPGDGRAGLVHPKFISPKRSTTHAW